MSSDSSVRRQFRSKSVASSDPLSPYFTNQRVRPLSGHLRKSPSVVCVPHYDAGGYGNRSPSRQRDLNVNGERGHHGKNGDIPGLNLTLSPNDPKTSTIRQHYYPEGGWGWVVLTCALIIHVLASALHLSVGFFILEIKQQFLKDQEYMEAVVLGALSTAVSLFLSPVVVAVCRRKSTRLMAILGSLLAALGCLFTSFATQLHQLYLSYGLFVGCGDSLTRETANIMVGQYFKKKRELVEMVVLIGKGVGMASVPLLADHWIRSLGWTRGLQLLAGIQCALCLVAVLYRPASLYHPQRRAILHIKSLQKRSKAKDKVPSLEKHPILDFSVLKSRTVQAIMLGTGVTAFGITAPLVLMMHEAERDKLSLKSMYQLQIILGLATSAGAAAFGLIVVKNSVQCLIAKQYLCQASSFLVSGWLLTFPTVRGFQGYVLFVCVYGVFYGGYQYSLKLCVFEKVRARNFAKAWGFLQWFQSIPGVIGVPITGYLSHVCGSRNGFYFSSLMVFIGTLILFLIDIHKSRVRKKKKLDEMRRFSDTPLQPSLGTRTHSQETVFGPTMPKSYHDLKKAQELTCISEEVLVDNFMDDYVDDGITSCNKEEKFLMLSEYENNLFKTEESDKESRMGNNFSGRGDPCYHCPLCARTSTFRSDPLRTSKKDDTNAVETVDEVSTSL